MSISLFTGTPGSGKTLHLTDIVLSDLERGVNVISNYNINVDHIKCKGIYTYLPDDKITVRYLINFARLNHKKGKEGSTKIVLDEAQLKFNARAWQEKNRVLWNKFFTVHRHLGYDIILATQKDAYLDSQVRGLIEYEFKHRNIKKSKLGKIIPFLPNWFITIQYWYENKQKINVSYFLLKDKVAKAYDSYVMFDKIVKELGT